MSSGTLNFAQSVNRLLMVITDFTACRRVVTVSSIIALFVVYCIVSVASAEGNSVHSKPHLRCGTVREISDTAVEEVQGD